MVVNSSKKVKRLSWEMSNWGATVGSGVSCGVEVFKGFGVFGGVGEFAGAAVFVGIKVDGKVVGPVAQAERTRLDTNIVEEIQECQFIIFS
jgi:hypothetical protein